MGRPLKVFFFSQKQKKVLIGSLDTINPLLRSFFFTKGSPLMMEEQIFYSPIYFLQKTDPLNVLCERKPFKKASLDKKKPVIVIQVILIKIMSPLLHTYIHSYVPTSVIMTTYINNSILQFLSCFFLVLLHNVKQGTKI